MIRFYEEGDAASLVIPVNSQFRKNIDWLDDNFPREVKNLSTTIFKSKTICLFDNNFRERQKDVLYQKEKKRKYQLSLCIRYFFQIRVHSVIYTADNVLTPEVITNNWWILSMMTFGGFDDLVRF